MYIHSRSGGLNLAKAKAKKPARKPYTASDVKLLRQHGDRGERAGGFDRGHQEPLALRQRPVASPDVPRAEFDRRARIAAAAGRSQLV